MTREELIAAVLADPDALWELRAHSQRVAGPWVRRATDSYRVADNEDASVGLVTRLTTKRAGTRCPNGHEGRGNAPFCKLCGQSNTRSEPVYVWRAEPDPRSLTGYNVCDSREEAEALVDLNLSLAGWLLAGQERE